jgi:hypothetical protein
MDKYKRRYVLNECDTIKCEKSCYNRSTDLNKVHDHIKNKTEYWKLCIDILIDYISCCNNYYALTKNKDEFLEFVYPSLELIIKDNELLQYAINHLSNLQLHDKSLQHNKFVTTLENILLNKQSFLAECPKHFKQKGGNMTNYINEYVNRLNKYINNMNDSNKWNNNIANHNWQYDMDNIIYTLIVFDNYNKSLYKSPIDYAIIKPLLKVIMKNKHYTKYLITLLERYNTNISKDLLIEIIRSTLYK